MFVKTVKQDTCYDTREQFVQFSKKEQRHIAREIINENNDVHPNDSVFWSNFFKKAGLDIF